MHNIYTENNCLRITNASDYTDEVVIRGHSLLTDYSFQENIQDTFEWRLFYLDDSGTVYYVESCQINKDLSDHRSHKNNDDNEEIFTDLLEPKTDDLECVEVSGSVYNLNSRDILCTVEGRPLSLCSHKELLILLTEDGDRYTFTGFRVQSEDNKGPTDKIHFNKAPNIHKHESCLLKIVTADLIEDESGQSKTTDSIWLENDLFKCLFGYSTALVNSPVLLFSPPDGSVYSIPVHVLFSQHKPKEAWLETNVTNTNNSWTILSETSQAVKHILTLRVPCRISAEDPYSNIEDDRHVLLICCSNGAVIAYYYDLSTQHEAVSQFVVQAPIVGADTHHNRFYHSTRSHLYESGLELIETNQGTAQHLTINIMKVTARKQARINQIRVEHIHTFTDIRESPCKVDCVQTDGTVRCLDSSTAFNTPNDNVHIKHILTSIDKTDQQQQQLVDKVKTCDHLLEQISIASFLLKRHIDRRVSVNEKSGQQPFCCQCKLVEDKLENTGGQGHVGLLCYITNQMPRRLSTDWSLEVTALPISHQTGPPSIHTSTVLPLVNGFNVQETATVVLPIKPDLLCAGVNLIVTLNLKITGLDIHNRNSNTCTCLSMAIYQEQLDILNFLVQKSMCSGGKGNLHTAVKIELLAHQQPPANCFIQQIDKNSDQESRTDVSLTKHLKLTNTQVHQLKDLYGQDPSCLISFLLKDSNLPAMDPSRNKCHVMTLTGHDLYLEVQKGQTSSNMTRDGPGEGTLAVLHIQSDVSTAAAVSMAIDRKLKEYSSQSGFPTTVMALQKKLHNIQSLEIDIQTVMNKKVTDSEGRQEIRNLYQKLRALQDTQ